MVIHDFHVRRSWRFLRPFQADPPLIVDANAVLPLAIALQRLEAIARQCRQILQRVGGFDPVQLETAMPDSPLTRVPAAKSAVRLSRELTITS